MPTFSKLTNSLVSDLSKFKPQTLTDIVRFVSDHKTYNGICLFLKNSQSAQKQILALSEMLWVKAQNGEVDADVQLAGILAILHQVQTDRYNAFVSRVSTSLDIELAWSHALATSVLLSKEVLNEAICISA